MNFKIQIIFGKEQVDRFISNIPLSNEEFELNVKAYPFKSKIELEAFKKGVSETIGWMEFHIFEKYVYELEN